MATLYITEADVEDEALKDIMTDGDYEYASKQLELFVTDRLGLTVEDIVVPIHLTVKEYVLAIAYARRAELNIGMGNRVMDGVDVYAYKHNAYNRKVNDFEGRITPAMITGISTSGTWSPVIELYRG